MPHPIRIKYSRKSCYMSLYPLGCKKSLIWHFYHNLTIPAQIHHEALVGKHCLCNIHNQTTESGTQERQRWCNQSSVSMLIKSKTPNQTNPMSHRCTLTSFMRDPTWRAVSGVCSAGLTTTVFPQAKAGAIFHVNISRGKFHYKCRRRL